MAKEKNNIEKKEDKPEIKEKQPRKVSHPNRLISIVKKHAFNLGIGIGAFPLSFVIFMLFFRGGDERRDIMEPGQDVKAEAGAECYDEISGKSAAVDSGASSGESVQDVFTAEDLEQFDVDTQKIIQELDFLFITPESDEGDMAPEAAEGYNSEGVVDAAGLLSHEDIDKALGDMGDQPADDGSFNMEGPEISQADVRQLSASSDEKEPANIELLMDVDLPVSIELGRTKMKISDILALDPGAIVELDKLVGEPVDLLVNQKCVARGEVVVVEESFGLRITQLVSPEERLKRLQ